jgi:hypothetical protein
VAFIDSVASNSGVGLTLTWNHTIANVPRRALVVGVTTDGAADVTGVTCAGVAMTALGAISAGSGTVRSELFGLVAPPTGVVSIVATAASSVAIIGGSVSVFDAHPTITFGTAATAASAGGVPTTAPTVNVATANAAIVVANLGWGIDGAGNPTAAVGAGQAEQWNDRTELNQSGGAGSTEPGAAATATMSWTLSAAENWAIVGVSVNDALLVPAFTRFPKFLLRPAPRAEN